MLKKEICKKCWNKKGEWIDFDELRWKEGYVWCPDDYVDRGKYIRYITDKPPSKCPYLLEYALINQED